MHKSIKSHPSSHIEDRRPTFHARLSQESFERFASSSPGGWVEENHEIIAFIADDSWTTNKTSSLLPYNVLSLVSMTESFNIFLRSDDYEGFMFMEMRFRE